MEINDQKIKDFRLMRCDLAAKKIENNSDEFIQHVQREDANRNSVFQSFSVFLWSINDAIDTAEAWFVSDHNMKSETTEAVKKALNIGVSSMGKIKESCGHIVHDGYDDMFKSLDAITKNLNYHLSMVGDPDLLKMKNNRVTVS
jgi:hypothetical protein